MKKLVLFTLIFLGLVSTTTATKDPAKENEDFSWLIEEVEELYEAEVFIEEVPSMIYLYDQEGNEIVSFEEAAYDQLPNESKRMIDRSELLFETSTDLIYMIIR